MEQLLEILVKVLLVAFIVGMFTLVIRMFIRSHKEGVRVEEGWEELRRVAAERDWTYEQRARGQATQYSGVGHIPSGSNLSAWHRTTGEFRGRNFLCFEHRAVNVSADLDEGNARPIIHSYFMISTPGSGPAMEILRPSRLDVVFDRRSSVHLGRREFDKTFRIVTRDETWVRNLLNDSMVSFLLTDPRAKRFPLELREDELFTWYKGTLHPQVLEEGLNYLCDVLDRIPAQLWTAA